MTTTRSMKLSPLLDRLQAVLPEYRNQNDLYADICQVVSIVREVIGLHERTRFDGDDVDYCGAYDRHNGCGEVWPCRTVKLIDHALNGASHE